jgi:hypothetical protein
MGWLRRLGDIILFGSPARLPPVPPRVKPVHRHRELVGPRGSEAGRYRDLCERRAKWVKD